MSQAEKGAAKPGKITEKKENSAKASPGDAQSKRQHREASSLRVLPKGKELQASESERKASEGTRTD